MRTKKSCLNMRQLLIVNFFHQSKPLVRLSRSPIDRMTLLDPVQHAAGKMKRLRCDI